ncbi:cytochrome P450, partial [Streptomyces sp. NPDC057496]|uniref:cytochrome P450 n=1 Tax=Streptomyces sp. NPDC057496 TaxID=3346149 RepID=UPI00367563B5
MVVRPIPFRDRGVGAGGNPWSKARPAIAGGPNATRARGAVEPPQWAPCSARASASVPATEVVEERGRRPGPGGTDPGHDEPDLLDALLTDADADASAREARAALQMIITGTHVVPGAALTWLMAELATRKGLSESIRAEVTTHGTTGDLPYTTAVVKESLRPHPPVWLMTRDVALPTRIAGHAVGPGGQVVFSRVHRRDRGRHRPDPHLQERAHPDRPTNALGPETAPVTGPAARANLRFPDMATAPRPNRTRSRLPSDLLLLCAPGRIRTCDTRFRS